MIGIYADGFKLMGENKEIRLQTSREYMELRRQSTI